MTIEYEEIMVNVQREHENNNVVSQGTSERDTDKDADKALAEESFDETLKEVELIPGKKYRGYYWVNSFGELHVQPEKTGTNPTGQCKEIEGKNFSVYSYKNCIKVIISIKRDIRNVMVAKYAEACASASAEIFKHEWLKKKERIIKRGV